MKENHSTNTGSQKSGKLMTGLTIVLAITVILLVIDRFVQQKSNEANLAQLEETISEKNSIEADLTQLYQDYDGLKTNNVELNKQLETQQARIQELLVEVQKAQSSNSSQIREYRKELETLRKIMKGYIYQIDSLNTMNHELIAENEEISRSYEMQRSTSEQLEVEKNQLSNVIAGASQLKATNIKLTGLNSNGRATTKLDKMSKLEVCFTLPTNDLASHGKRDVYVRIADPNGLVLTRTASDMFEYQGQMITYSAKRPFTYEGQELSGCIYWTVNQVLMPGKYGVSIIADNVLIGSFDVTLQ